MRYLVSIQFCLSFLTFSLGQSEGWTYCFNEVMSFNVNLVNEIQSGDSLIKTYSEEYSNTQIKLLHLNDTIYSEYNGAYYILGVNNPVVGDIWHPLRYHFMSFQDSSISCPNLMNVEVIDVNKIAFGNDSINLVDLKDLDLEFDGFNVFYQYLEGIGGTAGGPLYNLTQQYTCDLWLDFDEPIFRYFERDTALHEGLYEYPPLSLTTLELNNEAPIKILDLLGRETVPLKNHLQIYLYANGTLKKVYQVD